MAPQRPQGSIARTFLIGFLIIFGMALLVGWVVSAFA
jgi:hypothetical protein